MKKPWRQGQFDGLCGAYSILNAVYYLYHDFSHDDGEKLFAYMVKNNRELFADALLNGMGIKQLWTLAHSAKDYLAPARIMNLYRPFHNKKMSSSRAFLDQASTMIGPRAVMVIDLGDPWNHWSVATKITPKTICFRDSETMKRLNRSLLSLPKKPKLGSLKKSDTKVALEYHCSMVIERQ